MAGRNFEQIPVVDQLTGLAAFDDTNADGISRMLAEMKKLHRVTARRPDLNGSISPIADTLILIIIDFFEYIGRWCDRGFEALLGEPPRLLYETVE